MPAAFVDPANPSATPNGSPAVWVDAHGRAHVRADLYAMLDDVGRDCVHQEMDRLERDYVRHRVEQAAAPVSAALASSTLTPADRLVHSADQVIASAFEFAACIANFRDNLRAYGSQEEVSHGSQD